MKEGLSMRQCAKRLGRSHSTLSRELYRNRFHDRLSGEYIYEPLNAQSQAESRKEKAWKAKKPLKNKRVFKYVTERLSWGWSPEVISGRLREIDHKGEKDRQICMETIYQWIYKKEQVNCSHPWYEYLRRKQKRRKKKTGRRAHRVRIPDRVSIHNRPKVIAKRIEFGHWEGDTIVGRGRNHGLHTAYERVSSLIRFEKMPDLTALSSLIAQEKIYHNFPPKARRSTTLDNGHEHVMHKSLKEYLGIQTYFADPYSSWQRGGNENANLWIRYYFPKGTNFNTIPDEELRDVEYDLNSRPRKRLGYKTPLEVFNYHLTRCNRS